jgi:PAS domain S-box-containing protein
VTSRTEVSSFEPSTSADYGMTGSTNRKQSDDLPATPQALLAEIRELRQRLEEAEGTLHAIRTGQVDAFIIDRGRGERVYTLEAADRPYRLLVESMREGALVLGTEGQLLFTNASLAGMVGVARSSMLGEALARFVAPEDRPTLAAMLIEAVTNNVHRDITMLRQDGTLVPVHISMSALALSDMPGVCAIVIDLTERRQHEEMSRAQEMLKEADRRKDEFLATLAHELRNPLAPVRNAVQLLRIADPSHPDVRRAYDIIDRQVGQMTRLVDDLLDLSRITRGQIVLQRTQVDLATVVRAAIETSEPAIQRGGHTLTVNLPDTPVMLHADVTRLGQVFSNLLNNAAKYTNPGGHIEVFAVQHGDTVDVSVRDNGIGIAPELLPRVFEMFTQVGPSTDRSRTGLGIGLALVKRLLDLHKGSIVAESAGVGKGSEFRVTLPVFANVAPRAHVPRAERSMPSAQAKRVMVVDDNEDSAVTLGLLLERYGCVTCVVHDGYTALARVPEFRPDVILLDLGMPGLDGNETCRLLRREPWGQNIVVIALTGWGQAEDRRRTRESGFDHHLVKPVQPSVLMSVLTGRGRDASDRRRV